MGAQEKHMHPLRIRYCHLLLVGLLVGCGPNRWVRKGDLYLSESRPDAAARAFQKALDKDPSHAGALRGIAAAHLDRHEPIRAVVPAQRATTAGEPEGRRLLARALIQTGRADEAIAVLNKGIERVPKNAAWRRLLVEATLSTGDIEAAADLATSLEDFAQPRVLGVRAWALSRAGRHEEAARVATILIAADAENPTAHMEAASIFREAGQAGPYEQSQMVALAVLPANARDLLEEASYREQGGDREGAIRRLSWARALYPKDANVARFLGLSYAYQRNWSRAARELSMALNLSPYAEEPQVNSVQVVRAGDYAGEGQRRLAMVEMATRLGESLAQLGRKADAATAWQSAIDLNPAASDNDYIEVAKAWEMAGDVGRMMDLAQHVVDRNPGHAEAHIVLSRGLVSTGRLGWAIGHARKAFDIDPAAAGTAVFLGDLYEKRGERRAAAEVYEASLRHNPGDTRLLLGLQRVGRRR
jgi:tetratricopeptide (TPR) repeat protein